MCTNIYNFRVPSKLNIFRPNVFHYCWTIRKALLLWYNDCIGVHMTLGQKYQTKQKKAPTRFELVTSSLLDWRSNQLSYGAG